MSLRVLCFLSLLSLAQAGLILVLPGVEQRFLQALTSDGQHEWRHVSPEALPLYDAAGLGTAVVGMGAAATAVWASKIPTRVVVDPDLSSMPTINNASGGYLQIVVAVNKPDGTPDYEAMSRVDMLEDQMDAQEIKWETTRYSGVSPMFFDPAAPSFNPDRALTLAHSIGVFIRTVIGGGAFTGSVNPSSGGMVTAFSEMRVKYTAPLSAGVDYEVEGLLTYDPLKASRSNKRPVVIILPAWSGVTEYEINRARQIAKAGYVAFNANIYGALPDGTPLKIGDVVQNQTTRIALVSVRNDFMLYTGRIVAAVEKVKTFEVVDTSKIILIGYCFGGSGVLQYARRSLPAAMVVSFHGGQGAFFPDATPRGDHPPYVMHQSGGADGSDDHDKIAPMIGNLTLGGSGFEITRYAKVRHGFTEWGSAAYNAQAEERSWDAMMREIKMMDHGRCRPSQYYSPNRHMCLDKIKEGGQCNAVRKCLQGTCSKGVCPPACPAA